MISNNYEMYLTANNEAERLTFNNLPETIDITNSSANESESVVGLGEVTIFQDRPAVTISFSSYITVQDRDSKAFIDALIRLKNYKSPLHFICTNVHKINIYCTIEDLTHQEIGGDVGTIYFTLTLKEYRKPTVRQITVSENTAVISDENSRVDNRANESSYTVGSGDCLYNIAKAKLGDASRWTEIAELNGIKSPYTIHANQTLKLPGA